jgi:hypothetical protein
MKATSMTQATTVTPAKSNINDDNNIMTCHNSRNASNCRNERNSKNASNSRNERNTRTANTVHTPLKANVKPATAWREANSSRDNRIITVSTAEGRPATTRMPEIVETSQQQD